PVVWTDLANVSPTPDLTSNSIAKTGGVSGAWDAGAVSVQSFQSSDGFAQTTVDQTGFDRAFGLTRAESNAGLADIDYGFALLGTNNLAIYENGSAVATLTATYAISDILRVAVENGYVNFYKNGDLMYADPTRVGTPYSLSFDAS